MRQCPKINRKLFLAAVILAFIGFVTIQFFQHKRSFVLGPVFLSMVSCRGYEYGCPVGTFCQEVPTKMRTLPTETHGCRVLVAPIFDLFGIKKATRVSRAKYSISIDPQLPQEIKDCIAHRVNFANEHELVLAGDRMIISLKENFSSETVQIIVSKYKLQAVRNLDFVNAFAANSPAGKVFETACLLEKDPDVKAVELEALSAPL